MSGGGIVRLVLIGLVFLVWAFLMFRAIFTVARRASDATGAAIPGPAATLSQWRIWLTQPEDRQSRRALEVMTLALIVMSLTSALGG